MVDFEIDVSKDQFLPSMVSKVIAGGVGKMDDEMRW